MRKGGVVCRVRYPRCAAAREGDEHDESAAPRSPDPPNPAQPLPPESALSSLPALASPESPSARQLPRRRYSNPATPASSAARKDRPTRQHSRCTGRLRRSTRRCWSLHECTWVGASGERLVVPSPPPPSLASPLTARRRRCTNRALGGVWLGGRAALVYRVTSRSPWKKEEGVRAGRWWR